MKSKYLFLFSAVLLGIAFFDDSDSTKVYAEQAILDPMNPQEEVFPITPAEAASNSTETAETTETTESMETSTESSEPEASTTVEEPEAAPKKKKAVHKKVFVSDDLFATQKLKVTPPNSSGGSGSDTQAMSFYSQLCYDLSGSVLYGQKAKSTT